MLIIENPKQRRVSNSGRALWFPYYAGFSMDFVQKILISAHLPANAVVLDPWNGAGTTTYAALMLGLESIGFDINPAMVVAAKARSINPRDFSSFVPLALDIIAKAASEKSIGFLDDPLLTWLFPEGANTFRRIDFAIQKLLFSPEQYQYSIAPRKVDEISDIASFFYTALFRVLRSFLQPFIPSNPTWTKQPKPQERLTLIGQEIFSTFVEQVKSMSLVLRSEQWEWGAPLTKTLISTQSSENIPIVDSFVDFVVTSPPYCTRIDYAVATLPELAALGYRPKDSFNNLRRQMIGTSTVPSVTPPMRDEWGTECLRFLDRLKKHESKASSTYYFKSHVQYFASIYKSLSELVRVLKSDGRCVLVVQDSFYKEVHNNLPKMIDEMLYGLGAHLIASADFRTKSRMGNKHPATRKYGLRQATESVICFQKDH